MNVKRAAVLVRDNMRVVYQSSCKEDGYTHVRIEAVVMGEEYWATGSSKYRKNDCREGLPWIPKVGLNKATGRAVQRMARHIVKEKAKEEKARIRLSSMVEVLEEVVSIPVLVQ